MMHKHCVVTGRLNPDSINFLIVKVMLYEEDTLHNNVDMTENEDVCIENGYI